MEKQSRVFTTTYTDTLGGHLPIYKGNMLQGHLMEESLQKDNNVIFCI